MALLTRLANLARAVGLLKRPLPDRAPAGSGPRSPRWPACRAAWLKLHPGCAACGSTRSAQVHHRKPFHLFPALELDPANLITLCERPGTNHHLEVGHKDPATGRADWKAFNPDVEKDAARLLAKLKG